MTLIRACDLALGYDGKTVAENINFTVSEGKKKKGSMFVIQLPYVG